ncbi:regulator of volume decrease after cellular swelling-domain-containing protein [Polychytrium aggregatum]|uniref:regulator of volume decrease after cellular swelling-domain-containing protein n=1 Tax=Polychytrium aggregatum TaxID=110093 RepID=UPI0022FE3E59|nr:regulator of volume decrease after cellular swelling-domain-containing protein [Polychytrium aggregatum]KAI9203845.1 regulator of volume decrease after cellular swelling-domain-containing protein [Polychytrium aggregatum]
MPIQIYQGLPELFSSSNPLKRDFDPSVPQPIIRFHHKNVRLAFNPDPPALSLDTSKKGDLYVVESELIWHDPESSTSIAIDYPSILVHALSRSGDRVDSSPCIYCQLDGAEVVDAAGYRIPTILPFKEVEESADLDTAASAQAMQVEPSHGNNANDDDADEEAGEEAGDDDEYEDMHDMPCFELRLIPDDATALDSIYLALSECASLHPDKNAEEDGDEDEGEDGDGWIYGPSDDIELSEVGEAAMRHIEAVFDVQPRKKGKLDHENQFDDADGDADPSR